MPLFERGGGGGGKFTEAVQGLAHQSPNDYPQGASTQGTLQPIPRSNRVLRTRPPQSQDGQRKEPLALPTPGVLAMEAPKAPPESATG